MSDSQPPQRRPGRPKKFARVTGRQAAKEKLTQPPISPLSQPPMAAPPLPAQSPTNPDVAGSYCPPITSTESAFLSAMCLLPQTLRFNDDAGSTTTLTLFLDSIARSPPQWLLVDTVRTLDLPYWFDLQLNDYNVKRYNFSELVQLTWLGHPQDSPYDPRARPCMVQWKEPSPLSFDNREEAGRSQRVLCRWELNCRGACALKPPPGKQLTDGPPPEAEEVRSKAEYAHCAEKVKLVIELNASNLNVVNIWQRGSHPDTVILNELQPSRRLRNEVLTAMRLLGARVSVIMKDIVMKYTLPVDTSRPQSTSVVWLHTVPEWRRFTRRQLRTMFANVHKKARLDHDPLRAIDILARRNPNKIYFYTPHDRKKPDSLSKFTCAISTSWGLENLVLHGSVDGIGIDTTWRGMNENRAGVTFITTVDEHGHMVPGSALLSANIQTITLANYMNATEERVKLLAQDIIKDPSIIAHKQPGDQATILKECYRIQETGRWAIKKVMIDKCHFLLNAIQKHYPGTTVIICQFHIIQALCRLQGDDGRLTDAPRLTWKFKYHMCVYFREAQRCRAMEEWPTYQEKFFRHLERLCLGLDDDLDDDLVNHHSHLEDQASGREDEDESEDDSDTASLPGPKNAPKVNHFPWLQKYFLNNWFSDLWLVHVTDIGLPQGETRDGTSNTNNFSESGILVFGKVFLDCRVNKRIDRLAGIIMNEWFPFYEYWPSESRNPPAEIQLMILRAHKLWDQGMIRELEPAELAAANGAPPMYRVQEAVAQGHHQACIVDAKIPRCTCKQWSQTGKWCVHLRAVHLYESNGPISLWQEQEYHNQKTVANIAAPNKGDKQRRLSKGTRGRRPPSDQHLDRHVERVINALGPNKQPERPEVGIERTSGDRAPPFTQPPPPTLETTLNALPQDSALPLPTSGELPPPDGAIRQVISAKDGFRSGWSQVGGRPQCSRPLQASRHRRNPAVVFNKKRGRTGATRVSRNSLILRAHEKAPPPGGRQRKAALHQKRGRQVRAEGQTKRKKNQKNVNKPRKANTSDVVAITHSSVRRTSPHAPNHETDYTGLTAEDASILGTDFSRWNDPYQLRIEEMELIVEMLNSLSKQMHFSWWCFISGGAHQDKVIANVLTNIGQFATEENEFAQRLLSNDIHSWTQVIFFDLTHAHWTVWVYHLGPHRRSCTGINPMATKAGLNTVERSTQIRICNGLILRAFDATGRTDDSQRSLFQPSDDYEAALTGLQPVWDATSCGFWCVAIVLSRILGVPNYVESLSEICVINIQRIIAVLWAPFLSHPGGIVASEFAQVLETLGGDAQWLKNWASDCETVVAPRPAYIAQIDPPVSLRYPATWGQKFTEMELYTRICLAEGVKITFPGFQLSSSEITQLKDPNARLQSSMISGYLSLYTCDHRNLDWTGLTLPFYIFDVAVTLTMSQQKTTAPFKPRDKLNTWKFWSPEVNIFSLSWVFLPWHIATNEHWILVLISPKKKRITVHDSLSQKISRMHQNICNRVLKFLQFEHQARFGIPLPKRWEGNLDAYYTKAVIIGPLQHDNYSCGLIVIAVISAVCEGIEAEDIADFTEQDLLHIRQRVLVRLAREWEYIEDVDVAPITSPVQEVDAMDDLRQEVPTAQSPPCGQTEHDGGQDASRQPTPLAVLPYPLTHAEVNSRGSTAVPSSEIIEKIQTHVRDRYVPTIGENALWRPSIDEKFCPVFVVTVSLEESLAEIEIPAGIVDVKGVIQQATRYTKTFSECEEIFTLNVEEIYPEQVTPIIWPELYDDRSLQETLEAHDHQLDAIGCLTVQQREAISVMRENIPLIITSINGDDTVFPGLLTAWERVVRGAGHKMARVVAFADRHLELLDVQMRCIIQTVAYHELAPMIPGGTEKLTDYLGSCMLAYVALGHELKMAPQDVYRDVLEELITRPVSMYEKMWLTIETCTTLRGPARKWPQNKANFIVSHRISLPICVPQLIHHAAGKTDGSSKETQEDNQEGNGNGVSSRNPSNGAKEVDVPPLEHQGDTPTNEGEAVLSVPEAEAGARVGHKVRKRRVKGGVDELVQLEARKKLRKRG